MPKPKPLAASFSARSNEFTSSVVCQSTPALARPVRKIFVTGSSAGRQMSGSVVFFVSNKSSSDLILDDRRATSTSGISSSDRASIPGGGSLSKTVTATSISRASRAFSSAGWWPGRSDTLRSGRSSRTFSMITGMCSLRIMCDAPTQTRCDSPPRRSSAVFLSLLKNGSMNS